MKDISKIIKEFETDSYFYLSRQLDKCMVIYDAFNKHVYTVRT